MAYVTLDPSGQTVTCIFGTAQYPPAPPGYAIIDDSDPRISVFLAMVAAQQIPRPTPRQWLERLSASTQAAITKAAAADTTGALLLWLLKAAGNPSIDVNAAETQQGVQALVNAGVITAQDQQTLLSP